MQAMQAHGSNHVWCSMHAHSACRLMLQSCMHVAAMHTLSEQTLRHACAWQAVEMQCHCQVTIKLIERSKNNMCLNKSKKPYNINYRSQHVVFYDR